MHLECMAQLVAYAQGRDVLQGNPAVVEALEAVAKSGLTATCREMARNVLVALCDRQPESRADENDGDQHVMLSYQWNGERM